jgi:hypothetical protein
VAQHLSVAQHLDQENSDLSQDSDFSSSRIFCWLAEN